MPLSPSSLVWYVAYGSNLSLARFSCYVRGGTPPGASRLYEGCRDQRLPRASEPVVLSGGVFFALESRVWSGGMAFFDPSLPGSALARAYLVTLAQFCAVASQEMHGLPGETFDVTEALVSGRQSLGPGRYETLLCLGELRGLPLLTFTSPWGAAAAALSAPSAAYLSVVASGLAESHGLDAPGAAEVLLRCPGVTLGWDEVSLAALLQSEAAGA